MADCRVEIPRLMIVATASGVGKTSVVCGLLKAFKNRGLNVASFKCGPDYIDPMFHNRAIGIQSRNLDMFMCGSDVVKHLFGDNGKGKELVVLEGVMGVYDGAGTDHPSSSNDLALLTGTPQILVIDPRGQGYSVGALVYGFLHFRPNNIKGIILNNTSAASYKYFKNIIEETTGVKVYGHLPKLEQVAIGSRHLGLITADEIEDINQKLNLLGETCEQYIDLDALTELAREYAPFEYRQISVQPVVEAGTVKIAIARDKAFCFHYQDNIELLKKLGAEIIYFSPLEDAHLPPGINGLIINGGYPEEHAEALSANKKMLEEIKQVIKNKIPTIAECGGFMYLGETLTSRDGKSYNMVGAIKTKSSMTNKLVRFGYLQITANSDNLLLKKGGHIKGHEFHYSDSEDNGQICTAVKTNGLSFPCIHANKHLFAGYPHLHFWGNMEAANNFVKSCRQWSMSAV